MELIDKVGLELEGGYTLVALEELAKCAQSDDDEEVGNRVTFKTPHFEVTTDGSLSGQLPRGYDWREIRTRPVNYTAEWPKMKELIDTLAPPQFNYTCGLHIHVSMKSRALYAFMTRPTFINYMRKRLEVLLAEWTTRFGASDEIVNQFSRRLAGRNQYCLRPVPFVRQLRLSGGARYAFLNYCYHTHQTLECRVFPMMPPSLIHEAVEFYLSSLLQWPEWNKLLKPKQPKYFIYHEEDAAMNIPLRSV